MLIKKIDITNFRQYKVKTSVEFATDKNKNVTVLMGDNGAGKTTFAQAFMWCLYGDNDFKIKELINREVREAMGPGEKETVKVELEVETDGKLYCIIRKQDFIRTYTKVETRGCELTIRYKDDISAETKFMKEKESQQFIKRMLPKELSRFFIFDGERIRVMSDEFEAGKSKEFANAVHGLIGLNSLRKAIEHFKPTRQGSVTGIYSNRIDEQSDDKVRNYSREIARIKQDISDIEKRCEQSKKQVEAYRERSIKSKNELLEMATQIELKGEYEQLEKKIQMEKEKKDKEVTILFNQFSNSAMYYFEMPLIKESISDLSKADKLDKGVPKLHADTINFLLNRNRCICGESLVAGDKHYQELISLLDVVPPKSLGQALGEYISKIRKDVKIASTFKAQFQSNIEGIRKQTLEIEEDERTLTQIEDELADTSKAKLLQDTIVQCDTMIKSMERQIDNDTKSIGELEAKRKYQEAQRDTLIIADKKNMESRRLLEYSKLLYEKMIDEYDAKEASARKELQETINEIFTNIYDGGIKLEVDNRYNVKVSVSDDMASEDELERNTAQNYAIIFAFISGIIQMSKNKSEEMKEMMGIVTQEKSESDGYPLIMDAPLSAFDKRRIKSICQTIPGIAQQVIIFIKDTDGEVAEEHMSGSLGARYELVADSQMATHVEKR